MFEVSIKIQGLEKRRKSVRLFHLAAGFFLLIYIGEYAKHLNYNYLWPLLPFFVGAFLSITYGFFRKKIDPDFLYNSKLRMVQFLSFLGFGMYQLVAQINVNIYLLFIWSAIFLMLYVTERKLFQSPKLQIDQQQITIPGQITNRLIPWNAITHLIVRNDFITITLAKDRFMQFEVAEDLDSALVDTINNFCRQQINRELKTT